MSDNQTNQPSQPVDPNSGGSQRVSSQRRRGKRGHSVPHRGMAAPSTSSDIPSIPPVVPPSPSPPAAATPIPPHSPPPPPPPPPVSPAGARSRFEQGVIGSQIRKPTTSRHPAAGQPPTAQHKSSAHRAAFEKPVKLPIDVHFERFRLMFLVLVMVPLCIWASFPSWESMVYEWWHTDDYSHGFIVIPATILFLYMRLDTYPGTSYKLDWVGLSPILFYGAFRVFAGLQYIDFIDAVAIWFWILSIVWFFYGRRAFLWALPSLCFLVFMFQLPWRIDVLMRNHLQMFAAHSAAVLLQLAGEAAVPIKNTIRLSTMELGVEAACSGLRFLISVFAIAFAAVLLLRRPWWQNLIILAVAAPLALFVNAVRIALTGILLVRFPEMVASWTAEGESASVVADGFAGKITIFLALGLFALFIWYLGKIFRQVEV